MKTIRFCIYLLVLSCFHTLSAQEELGNGLLLPQFEQGTVVFKNGVRSPATLNYDMIQEQMLFLDVDNTVMRINKPLDILVVIIGERRFFPISSIGVFYEEIQAGKDSFFVERRASIVSQGKASAYGGYSQTQSSTSYGSWQSDMGGTVQLKADEKFKLDIKNTYYLKSGNNYKRFLTANSLGKLFKGHESEIKAFADEESINFRNLEDVVRLVEYAYSLK